jgi:4-hydroxy-3-polyprenylbenzoate decarboxylase
MAYRDLRDFMDQLERDGELRRVRAPVDPNLEMTAFCDRVLRLGGPAILFETPKGDVRGPSGATIPVLGNLFGTPGRVARAMGADPANWRESLREIGRLLAFLKEPEPPKSLLDAWQTTRPVFMKVLDMAPKERSSAPCQEVVWEGRTSTSRDCRSRRAGPGMPGRCSRGASRSRAARTRRARTSASTASR